MSRWLHRNRKKWLRCGGSFVPNHDHHDYCTSACAHPMKTQKPRAKSLAEAAKERQE